jgi:hypothetical protein
MRLGKILAGFVVLGISGQVAHMAEQSYQGTAGAEAKAAVTQPNDEKAARKAAIFKVMADAVAARHGGVLPLPTEPMSEQDMGIALKAAADWTKKQATQKTKLAMDAMKVKPAPSEGYGEIALAKESISKMLRDPSSAVFSDVFFVNDRKSETGYYVPTVCGTVNGKNGFGGMTGPKHFVAGISDVVSGVWMEGTTSRNVFASEWNRFCAGKHG